METAYHINHIGTVYNQPGPYGNAALPPNKPQSSPTAMPEDRVTFSKAALVKNGQTPTDSSILSNDQDMSPEEKQVVNDLKRRDAEVKAHESAHMAAGSGIVQGGASFEYQSGPDGKMYAVGGEVQIDVSPENTPEATIQKMQQVRAAALAPAQPSGTDRAVAAQASQIEAQARIDKMLESKEDQEIQEDQGADALRTSASGRHPYAASQSTPGSHIDFMA